MREIDRLIIGPISVVRGEMARGWLAVPGTSIQLPLTMIHGANPGKVLLVTAGVHGGEYPGIEAAIQLARTLDPKELSGSVIIAPIVSPTAFHARMQYCVPEDGLNLNRQFPGIATGTVSQRIAACVMNTLAAHADAWVDLHGGDIHEELMPFTIYSSGATPAVREQSRQMAKLFGIRYLVESDSVKGGTYGAAASAGIPAILTEAGDIGQLNPEMVAINSRGLQNILQALEILPGTPEPISDTITLHTFAVLTSAHSACWYTVVRAGDTVVAGDLIGELRDYFGEILERVIAPITGVVLYRVTSLAVNAGDPLAAIGA
ncbi:MAG: M14 family metallopeptidase [Roseiflexaceae bacterium]|nr:M14 family metallopeptidase [Roseiflexaceae bacterium]